MVCKRRQIFAQKYEAGKDKYGICVLTTIYNAIKHHDHEIFQTLLLQTYLAMELVLNKAVLAHSVQSREVLYPAKRHAENSGNHRTYEKS